MTDAPSDPALPFYDDESAKAHFRVMMRGYPQPGNRWLEGLDDLMEWCLGRGKVRLLVEIGSFAGQSTCIFACYAKWVHAIDPLVANYDPAEEAARFMVGREHLVEAAFLEQTMGLPVTLFRETSQVASTRYPDQSVDMVYIDACHRYEIVRNDIRLWLPKVMPGGFLAGHDFWPEHPFLGQAAQAVRDEMGREPDAVFQDTSWVYQVPVQEKDALR